MKQTRLLVITIIAFLMLVLASGCGKTYELPWDQFCIKIDGNIEIVLSAEDKNYIIDLLNKGDWINDLGDCGCEYVFFTRKEEVRYHSECGTFNDYTNKRSFTVSEEQRQRINEMLNVGNESIMDKKTVVLSIAETRPSQAAFEYKDGKPYCFYAYDSEGSPYRVLLTDFGDLKEKDIVTVYFSNEIQELNEINPPGEWSVKYEINAESVTNKINTTNLTKHISISSGTSTINPFSCLVWSRVDNGNGTYSETHVDKYDVVDLVNGKVPFSGTEIPVLQMDSSINELISGIVKNTKHIPSLTGTATYRIPDALDCSLRILCEVKNYSGVLSYTNQLKDFVLWSQANGFQMYLYTNATLSKTLELLKDSGIIRVVPLG